ncbi:hypothetical protein HDU84_006582 [Entophlyctis sp. JEL0112]|nr:hypothetical protein HDU84_006582 [Entophlyctis sp. JEL0112]
MRIELELCVESVDAALVAQKNGAARIELCASLVSDGGVTPSLGLIELAVKTLTVPVMVMIRPRGGDFCYSDLEFEVMKVHSLTFDMTRDPFQALEDIIGIGGIDRILTSGQDKSVLEGLETLQSIVERAKGRIIIMPGGGINVRNLERILKSVRVTEIHMSLMKTIESPMEFRRSEVCMGQPGRSEFVRYTVDTDKMKQIVAILNLKAQ